MEKVESTRRPLAEDPACHRIQLPPDWAGQRLDRVVARLFAGHSRAEVQEWIAQGQVQRNGGEARAKDKVAGGDWLTVTPPEGRGDDADEWLPQPVALDVVHCDEDLIVLAKAVGQVVHPAPGHSGDTLANGLLYRFPELAGVERAGIVHRLDRDTSGLLVVARTPRARESLVAQFQAHSVDRCYTAVVAGELTSGGKVDAPIARHPRHRTRFAVVPDGKRAVTHFRVARRFRGATEITARLETGRTHQVRVHMAHIGHPVLGDPVYSGKPRIPPGLDEVGRRYVAAFRHQALHAGSLGVTHPGTGERMHWEQPLPPELQRLIDFLAGAAQ